MADSIPMRTVIRWSGGIAAGAGMLWAVFPVLFLLQYYGGPTILELGLPAQMVVLPVVGMLAGTVAVAHRHSGWFGPWGYGGTALTGAGLIAIGQAAVTTLVLPWDFVLFIVAGGVVVLAAGAALLGWAIRTAAILPTAAATLMAASILGGGILGGLAAVAGLGYGAVAVGVLLPYGLSWVWLGYALWQHPG